MDIKRLCTLVIYGGSFVLFIIGFALPYWINEDNKHAGLWISCAGLLGTICASIPSSLLPDYYKATQAMETLGLIAAAGGLFLCGFGVLIKPGSNIIRVLAGLAGIVAAGFIMIGVIVFGAKKDEYFPNYDLTAGFILAIISSFGLGFSGILCFVIKSADGQNGETRFSGAMYGSGGASPGTIITTGK